MLTRTPLRLRGVVLAVSLLALAAGVANAGTLPKGVSTEIEITSNSEYERNTDLDRGTKADVGVTEPEVAATIEYEVDERVSITFGMTLGGEYFFIDQANDEEDLTKLELDKLLFVYKSIAHKGLKLEFGRQKLRDYREWLLSETLDGGRVVYASDSRHLDFSITREKLVRVDLINPEDEPPIDNYAASAQFALSRDFWLGGYVLHRNDRTAADEDLTFFGLRSRGEFNRFNFWIDTGHVTGGAPGTDVSGFAIDVGLTKRFDAPLSPSLTLGYAWGSGDGNPNNGNDRTYRQTGLHANESEFAGLSAFKYYGQVIEPDLSNIHILTLGVGIRPTKDRSLDIIYHHYRLDEYADEFSTGRIEGDLNRTSKDLGHEIDVVLGMKNIAGLEWLEGTLIAGYFWPGKGFASNTNDSAAFISMEFVATFESPGD